MGERRTRAVKSNEKESRVLTLVLADLNWDVYMCGVLL